MTAPFPALDRLDDPPLPGTTESLRRARRLVSPRTGLIKEVVYGELAPDDPPLYWVRALPADAEAAGGRMALARGGVVSADRERAILKAVGESLERYCAAQYDLEDLTTARAEALGAPAYPPDVFALFSPEQYDEPGFRWSRYEPDTLLSWAEGTRLTDGARAYVPAAFVFVPWGAEPRSGPLWMPISTGLACGPSFAQAAYRALLELIERDAFMIVWQNELQRPRIDLESVGDPLVRSLAAAWRHLPFQCHAVLLTLDIPVSVVLGVLRSEDDRSPFTVVGLGVDLDPTRAVALALEELAQGFVGMRRVAADAPTWRPAPDHHDVNTVTLHGHAHAVDPALRETTEFLVTGEVIDVAELTNRAGASPLSNLRQVVADLAALGLEAIAVDLTTEDVDMAGFKVVRVVVPGLQPLDVDHTTQYRGGRRLYEVPSHLGLRSAPTLPGALNVAPHPFP